MVRRFAAAFVGFLSAVTLAAGAPADSTLGWKRSASGTVNLSQAYFDNWTKGGANSVAWEGRLEGLALRTDTHWDWESKGRAVFGQSRLGDLGTRKSADELSGETMVTRKLDIWANPFASTRFQTQFAPGYFYDDTADTSARVSGWFDPAYLTQTIGLGRTWDETYKVRLGASLKETFSSERYGYADDAATASIETFKVEPGASFTAEIRRGLVENVLLTSVLDVFANFKGLDAVDVRWENQVTAKVNAWLSANAAFDLLYDKDLSSRRQIRQSLAVGISFLSI